MRSILPVNEHYVSTHKGDDDVINITLAQPSNLLGMGGKNVLFIPNKKLTNTRTYMYFVVVNIKCGMGSTIDYTVYTYGILRNR